MDRFDKALHVHGQIKMASTLASGNSLDSARSKDSANDILRNRAFANQESVTSNNGSRPLYYVNSSNGLIPSNPNTLVDMGGPRNCVYQIVDGDEQVNQNHHNVKWRNILETDQQLE